MGLKDKISERGKQILLSPTVMRWVSDDRVMKAAEGLMDAPSRMKAAWSVLKNGHDLPAIDPAVDESMGEVDAAHEPSPRTKKANGSAAHEPAPTARSLGSEDMKESLKERSSLSGIGGRDVFEKAYKFSAADNARKMGIYPFFRPLDLNDGPEASMWQDCI